MPAKDFRKTHCYMGHPLSGDNVRIRVKGRHVKRDCKQCDCDRHKRSRQLKSNARFSDTIVRLVREYQARDT